MIETLLRQQWSPPVFMSANTSPLAGSSFLTMMSRDPYVSLPLVLLIVTALLIPIPALLLRIIHSLTDLNRLWY